MSLLGVVLGNRWLTSRLMSRMPASVHVRAGEKRALEVARIARTRTRAYADFLESRGLGDAPLATMDDFCRLPLVDKNNYVDPYPLEQLILDGDFCHAYTIEKSSGHAGVAYYWLRLPEEDALFPRYIEFAFCQYYGLTHGSTLILVTLALGTWTSGEKFAQALRQIAATGKYQMTVMAPGTDLDELLEIVSDLGSYYDRVIMIGYPPFLKSVLDEGTRRGVDWKSMNMRLGVGGEGYSEQWREHMASIIGVDSRRDLLAIGGGYGAADVGMSIGREYPVTVMIRQLCMDDPELALALFKDPRGRNGVLPGLVQYNPKTSFVEEVDQELVFTVLSGIPLVRYNIHDHGGVIPFREMLRVMRDHGYDVAERLADLGYGPEHIWQLPFFYVFGRSDGTVSIVGANIFPENIQAVLSEAGDQDVLTFRLSVKTDLSYTQQLAIALEHHAERLTEAETAALETHYHALLVRGLTKLNQDFKDAFEDNPEVADPLVTIHARGSGPFSENKRIKNQYFD